MGMLIDGHWQDQAITPPASDGAMRRSAAQFRNWITPDGAPGRSGKGGFTPQPDRYHLYVSLACPWAHRTLIFRKLKGLEDVIGVSVVHPDMLDQGWSFSRDFRGVTGDTVNGFDFVHHIYSRADPRYTGRVSVPVLWDKTRKTIVSNESSEIIRMFNSAFDDLTGNTEDYWPRDLRDDIETVNTRIYETVNNGVYKCGFATTQTAYDASIAPLFESLGWLESYLAQNRFLVGGRITEADWRLFTTLIRFDPVYHGHFKCNRRRLIDFPNLWAYARELYQWPGVAETVAFDHIKRHYYFSHESINPHRIVPVGPELDYWQPHGRVDLPDQGMRACE